MSVDDHDDDDDDGNDDNQLTNCLSLQLTVLNVAVGKAAMQSSHVGQGSAQKAVDGSK